MRLHDIHAGNPRAIIVGSWNGGNGGIIGGRPFYHLVEVERTPPPPIGEGTFGRQYWHPWNFYGDETLNTVTRALCQNIRTRARWQTFAPYYGWNNRGPEERSICPTCMDIARARGQTWTIQNVLQDQDPWTTATRGLNHLQRRELIDPVTGL